MCSLQFRGKNYVLYKNNNFTVSRTFQFSAQITQNITKYHTMWSHYVITLCDHTMWSHYDHIITQMWYFSKPRCDCGVMWYVSHHIITLCDTPHYVFRTLVSMLMLIFFQLQCFCWCWSTFQHFNISTKMLIFFELWYQSLKNVLLSKIIGYFLGTLL